jgi:hypothetical protein
MRITAPEARHPEQLTKLDAVAGRVLGADRPDFVTLRRRLTVTLTYGLYCRESAPAGREVVRV